MKHEFRTETTNKLLFTLFDSSKQRKTNMLRVHHHTELELGFITEGEGIYVLDGECCEARAGDLFLVRTNEQHCVPTIYSDELTSFNIHMNSFYLWNVCSEYIEPSRLRMLIGGSLPIQHKFSGRSEVMRQLFQLCTEPERHRHTIRRLVLALVEGIADELPLPDGDTAPPAENRTAMIHLNDIQNAITYIGENLTEPLTLDEIARQANLSRSHLSTLFKHVTGVTPYEYLLLQRVERAVTLLRERDATILDTAQECGFRNLANFNKTFKKVTGMTPSDYRMSKRGLHPVTEKNPLR